MTKPDERPDSIPVTESPGDGSHLLDEDGSHLLDGENPLTTHARDAARWMNIYRELIALQEDMLARDGRDGHDGDGASTHAHQVALAFDVVAASAQLGRYRRRLDFWYDRHWQLQGLEMDPKSHLAQHRHHQVHLTRREYQLLSHFLAYPNRVFSASELAQRAWSDSRLSTDQVRIYVARLRRRLADLDLPCKLVSQPRRGYRLVCE